MLRGTGPRMCSNAGKMILLILSTNILCYVNSQILTPPYFNLAEGRKITATATCGEEGPELYCKLVGANVENDENINVIQGQVCDHCDANNPSRAHPAEYAVDGMETWWQSPPLSRSMKYNEVNLTIDLGQPFHVAYVYVRMGNSPRPGLWALEKSSDFGQTYTPWQYFSDSLTNCEINFGKESLLPITRDDSVVCNTEYSKIVPLEGGEIPISLLNNRPSANMYFNSSVLQEWTRATNVRLRLLRTKTLLGHLMSISRQDPTVTRRYFYSIKDISIGGRCMCNGHADTCDLDPEQPSKLKCSCQHHTCGSQCATCCPGFEQKKWRQSQHWKKFTCEPCNCHNHTKECIYDAEVDAKSLSMDMEGIYEGGGVCQNCQDNTEGINCNKCKATFFRSYEKKWNDPDVCQPCQCNYHYSTGNCEEGSGQCECRPEFNPPLCDSCREGYFDYPNCKPCTCNLEGTENHQCVPEDGKCPCKYNYNGLHCKDCADGFFSPDCQKCNCNEVGSISNSCDKKNGKCVCKNNFGGQTCNQCEVGFYNYPTCKYCNCDNSGTVDSICNNVTGACICKEGFGGPRCDQCISGYYSELRGRERVCVQCNCSSVGSAFTSCDTTGKCKCIYNFAGKQCDQCSPGFYKYPDCLSCGCESHGAIGVTCSDKGQCQCKENFDNMQCNMCKEGFYNFPICEECNCDPMGVIESFAGCGSVPEGELCKCKERVQGRICDECRPLYWNLQQYNPSGCEDCECHLAGTQGGIGVCDIKSGQCTCKTSVGDRVCNQCQDGFYNLSASNIFGCVECDCDIGGSVSHVCDKRTGQCACNPRITGRRCDEPLIAHYFPTLHQYQYEVEDGRTPSHGAVRYRFSQNDFPGYSWKGYAIFSQLQNEILQEVRISKSSLYRIIVRYVNPTQDTIIGTVTTIPESPGDILQSSTVNFKPTTTPQYVTVATRGNLPSPFVMNPGFWDVSIKTDKKLLVDYFVLIPAAYYEATILTKNVEHPCLVGDSQLCRHFAYPTLTSFDAVQGSSAREISSGQASQYITNRQQLFELEESFIPLLNKDQLELTYDLVSKPGMYYLLIEYTTPANESGGGEVTVVVRSDGSITDSSKLVLDNCPYTFPCRQVWLDEYARVKFFNFPQKDILVSVQGSPDTSVGIKSIVAIPFHEWHLDYIKPKPLCVRKNNKCISAVYPIVSESKKIEFESNKTAPKLESRPAWIFDNTTDLIYVSGNTTETSIGSKITDSYAGKYVFIIHYYQPDHPEFTLDVQIQNDQGRESKTLQLPISHCPSNSGCRSVVQQPDGNIQLPLQDNFTLFFKNPTRSSVWLDYVIVIPAHSYDPSVLTENNLDQTREFISACGQNHYHVDVEEEGFCRSAVFSLTTHYNAGALPCSCDYLGALSFECASFGGQCNCKPNVIGRTCQACEPGYYGFPDCKPCNCPSIAICEKETGKCICPTNVAGRLCDKCMPLTYGFDPLVGCSNCDCDPMGVLDNQLQCDLQNGSCPCKSNIVGRMCDNCVAGYYSFPYCDQCNCDLRGTTDDICSQDTAECFCKSNVVGHACDVCKEGHFNLIAENPAGCTKCFCFGKTSRCSSAKMYWATIAGMDGWTMVNVIAGPNMLVSQQETKPQNVDNISVGSVLSPEETDGKVLYFGAPRQYRGNRLSSYGGKLNYTVLYTVREHNGNAITAGDVILEGPDGFLIHNSLEQPPAGINWNYSLHMVESEFVTPTGQSVSREQFMTAMQDLRAIYVRGTYWDSTGTTRLQLVSLDIATDFKDLLDESEISAGATSIESCQCPSAYKGLSCEQCAEGHYRVQNGPYGGYCVPCQCNGHSNICDVNTGVCLDCQDSTTGDHCEECIMGYHGNALGGTPKDCLICACPLPIESNNFAQGCELGGNGSLISCDCLPGYYGATCKYCAAGYYGQPDIPGEYCKPCRCSGNIIPDEPGSCDSNTGECLKCVNNTSGAACNLCRPGFFGDAVVLKNCEACICDANGTADCENSSGKCVCHEGVVGDSCDRCLAEHWGLGSGRGCTPCDCGVASLSSQCDDETGQCRCAPGVTGRRCDVCARGYWNYTSQGCLSCNCNKGYSIGFSCNAATGQCECLQGVIGDKCDHCPYRWVLIPDEGCYECDSCSHALLDFMNELDNEIKPVLIDFQNKASGYFTAQRLTYTNDKVAELRKSVEALDPDSIHLAPITNISTGIDLLEMDAKNLVRKAEYGARDGETLSTNIQESTNQANEVHKDVKNSYTKTQHTVDHIVELSVSLDVGGRTKSDHALEEAKQILSDIKAKNLGAKLNASQTQLDNTNKFLKKMENFTKPVADQIFVFENLRNDLLKFNLDLEKLTSFTNEAKNTAASADNLNAQNREAQVGSKVDTVIKQSNETSENIIAASLSLANASQALLAAESQLDIARRQTEGIDLINRVNSSLQHRDDDIGQLSLLRNNADDHSKTLIKKSVILNELLTTLKNNDKTRHAVTGASAYPDIVKEIESARNASNHAFKAARNITTINNGLSTRAEGSRNNSTLLYQKAVTSQLIVEDELKPNLLKASEDVRNVKELHQKADDFNKAIIASLPNVPKISLNTFIRNATDNTNKVSEIAREVIDIMKQLNTSLPDRLILAKRLPKDVDDTIKQISLVHNQFESMSQNKPQFSNLIDSVQQRRSKLDDRKKAYEDNIKKLRQQIATAKDLASQINFGMEFDTTSTLQLVTPDNVDEMSTSTHVSAYFRTPKESGFLMYLGNQEGTNLRRTKRDDFMALEVQNGYPVLTISIGAEPVIVNSNKYVSDDVWYQIIVDRVGNNVQLTVKEELDNGTVKSHTTEKVLPGTNTVFNLNKDQSKLFVGGYPTDYKIQDAVSFSSFEGQIEELMIGDTPVGLWNFVDAQGNIKGAKERTRLIHNINSGYKFNGEGYATVESQNYKLEGTSTVQLQFKTYSPEGLLFLVGDGASFLSIEMREGQVFLQYRLDTETLTIGTLKKYNDGEWHQVTATRVHKTGQLKVDGDFTDRLVVGGDKTVLSVKGDVYIGGHPTAHGYIDVTPYAFDGCLSSISIGSTPVDLSSSKTFGVRAGCPVKYPSLVSFDGDDSYLKLSNASSANQFQLSLKFRTSMADGLLFYCTNVDQTAGISLSLQYGKLVLISQKEQLSSGSTTYNDDKWHVVTVLHNNEALKLLVDDYELFITDNPPPPLHLMYGDLFIGGVKHDYTITPRATTTRQSFKGCLGDATLNSEIINFARAIEKHGESLAGCGKANKTNLPFAFNVPRFGGVEETLVTETPTFSTGKHVPGPTSIETTTSTQPPPKTKKPIPYKTDDSCSIPSDSVLEDFNPSSAYRFGTKMHSRIEFSRLPARHKNGYDLSVELKADSEDGGLIFYGADPYHNIFMALYIMNGTLHYDFKCGGIPARLVSAKSYNDGAWHTVAFSRDSKGLGKISVNNQVVAEGQAPCVDNAAVMVPPFFYGGVENPVRNLDKTLQATYRPFKGCLRNLQMSDRPVSDVMTRVNVPACEDPGDADSVYFQSPGGYLKLMEHFNVGRDMEIAMDIKPRNSSGLLLSVHGKRDYLVLELNNNEVVGRVENGKGPFQATYKFSDKNFLLDGEWHTIHVVKSSHVISLAVDGHFMDPVIGVSPTTDTKTSLFIGGHQHLHKGVKGSSSKVGYSGCIRNLIIKKDKIPMTINSAHGCVMFGVCPAN